MSDALKRFVVDLASDVSRLSAFMENPSGAMAVAGLTDEDQAILTGGDQGRIYAYLKGLQLPPASPAPPPPQMPTVVAAMQGQPAAAASAPAAGVSPAGASPPMIMAAMFFAAAPTPQWTGQPVYYVVQWPSWPPR